MASTSSLVTLLALSVLVSVATTVTSSNTVSDPLLSACRLTPESEICLKYLSMFPKSLTGNIHNITALSVSASTFLAKEINAFVSLLKKEAVFSVPLYGQCLNSSEIAIKEIVGRLNDLMEAVRIRSFADVSVWISEAWTDAMAAEKICKGNSRQPNIPQLSNLINDLRKMLRVISALFRLDAQ